MVRRALERDQEEAGDVEGIVDGLASIPDPQRIAASSGI